MQNPVEKGWGWEQLSEGLPALAPGRSGCGLPKSSLSAQACGEGLWVAVGCVPSCSDCPLLHSQSVTSTA